MLRAVVLVLLLLNLLLGAYGLGWLGGLGLQPQSQREPERLAQQVTPERLSLVGQPAPAAPTAPTEPAAAETPPQAASPDPDKAAAKADAQAVAGTPPALPTPTKSLPTACWQAGGYNPAQTIVLNAALQALPALDKRWSLSEAVLPARWIVYLGKFATLETLQRRKEELKDSQVEFREVKTPALVPGLALGTYSSEDAAKTALRDVGKAGVRGAKVVQERAESRSVTLKLPAITEPERARVQALPGLAGKTLQPCS